jgi:hypothetical protein
MTEQDKKDELEEKGLVNRRSRVKRALGLGVISQQLHDAAEANHWYATLAFPRGWGERVRDAGKKQQKETTKHTGIATKQPVTPLQDTSPNVTRRETRNYTRTAPKQPVTSLPSLLKNGPPQSKQTKLTELFSTRSK